MNSIEQDLVAALYEIQNPPLDGRANYGKYATLPACLDAARKTLARHSLAVLQMVYPDPDRLVTRIVHASGNFIEDGGVPLLCENKSNPQKMGSAITYARRYGLCAMLCIVGEEDDDGQRATPADELPPERKEPTKDTLDFNSKSVWAPFPSPEAWVADQIQGFPKHKDLSEHMGWSGSEDVKAGRAVLERDEPELFKTLSEAYVERKDELKNTKEKK